MVRNKIDEILDRCVSMVHTGVSIEDAVAAYPAQALVLRERLAVAQTLSSAIPRQPYDAAMLARARSRFLAAVRERSQGEPATAPASSVFGFATRGVRRLVLVPYALPAVAAMVILGGAAAGIAAGTGNSNPRAWFPGYSSTDEVKLQGMIAAIDASEITITTGSGDATVQITPQTEFKDENNAPLTIADFAAGDFVKISAFPGVTGALVAHEVERDKPDDGAQPPAATATDNSNPGPGGPTDEHQGDDANPETPDGDDARDDTPENDDSHGPGPEGTKEPDQEGEDGQGTPTSDGLDDDREGTNHGSSTPVLSDETDKVEDDTGPETSPDGAEPDKGHDGEADGSSDTSDAKVGDGSQQQKPADGAAPGPAETEAPTDALAADTGSDHDLVGATEPAGPQP